MNLRTTFRRRSILAACALVSVALIGTGCENDAQSGSLLGAGIGALAGQAIGGDTEATLIGAGAGAGLGYVFGNESDKKKQEQYQNRNPNYDY
ncbi:MAG: glycine zipper domain-containing protein [Planctomycetota bacterium]